MNRKSRNLTALEVIRILERNGFIRVSQKGSHVKLKSPCGQKKTIVALHPGDLPLGTVKAIERQTGVQF